MAQQAAWTVKFKLPGDQVRTPRQETVHAATPFDAEKVFKARYPTATVLGQPQRAR